MPHKILIVDDSPTQTALLAHTLKEYIVEVAKDGVTGLEKALNDHYDLLILDLNLPDIDGQEVCKRYLQVKQNTSILIVSSEDQLTKIKAIQNAGKIYYSVKDAQIVANRVELIFLRLRRRHCSSTLQLKETVWQN